MFGDYEKAIAILHDVKFNTANSYEKSVVEGCIRVLQDALDDEREAYEIHNSQGYKVDWDKANQRSEDGTDIEF